MTYFISGHRDITPEEFEKFYVPAIVDVIDTCNDNYDDCEFVVGDCRGCDEMAANFIANYIKENTDDTECPPCILCIYHMFSEPRFNPGIRESEVRWDSMLAIRADYRYRNELEDALIIPVYNDLLDPSGNFQIWTPEPIARTYLDDCIKYVGEDTKDLKYGDLLCVYSMTLSEYSLYAIQLSNYKLHKLDTSVCVLEGKGYALAKDTKVKVVLDSAYTEVGQTGKIYHTDYRSALPYEVIMDKGDCVWVAGCTIQNVDTEVYIEEYSADVENEVSPDKDILENGFSRQVTFYEKD